MRDISKCLSSVDQHSSPQFALILVTGFAVHAWKSFWYAIPQWNLLCTKCISGGAGFCKIRTLFRQMLEAWQWDHIKLTL